MSKFQRNPSKRGKIKGRIYRSGKTTDRFINSQTIEMMFANKLVAVTDRHGQHNTLAGRDIHDIHPFFVQGYAYNGAVIRERTGLEPREYFAELITFIKKHSTQTILNEDLNTLLPYSQFQQVRNPDPGNAVPVGKRKNSLIRLVRRWLIDPGAIEEFIA